MGCTLFIRVLFYSIQEYSSWLMNMTLFCTACIVCLLKHRTAKTTFLFDLIDYLRIGKTERNFVIFYLKDTRTSLSKQSGITNTDGIPEPIPRCRIPYHLCNQNKEVILSWLRLFFFLYAFYQNYKERLRPRICKRIRLYLVEGIFICQSFNIIILAYINVTILTIL